jgi:hypothetical protein
MGLLQVHRAITERDILAALDHPFLPTLYASFQASQDASHAVTLDANIKLLLGLED